MTIVEFLEAQWAEEEQIATSAIAAAALADYDDAGELCELFRRVLREVAAKRKVIAAFEGTHLGSPWDDAQSSDTADWGDRQNAYCRMLATFATTHSSHPDYQKEWAL